MRRFYAMLQENGVIAKNPLVGLPIPKPLPSMPIRYLRVFELKVLLDLPDINRPGGKPQRDKAILTLMALHGMQVHEISRLQLADLNLDVPQDGCLTVTDRRGAPRHIQLSPLTRSHLATWLTTRAILGSCSPYAFIPLAWNGISGDHLSCRGIRAMVDQYLEQAGLKDKGVSCQALCNSHTLLSIALGADRTALERGLGRAGTNTIRFYERALRECGGDPAQMLGLALEVL